MGFLLNGPPKKLVNDFLDKDVVEVEGPPTSIILFADLVLFNFKG